MATPYACPICHGRGKVAFDFYDTKPLTIEISKPVECRTCKGRGILWDYPIYILPNLPKREDNLPKYDNNKPYNPCENCPVRQSPNWGGFCHCALPYLNGNNGIRW